MSFRSIGHDSSSQVELVVLRLGYRHALGLEHFQWITFICDNQRALRSLKQSHRTLIFTLEIQNDLQTLSNLVAELRLWWNPSYFNLTEAQLTDAVAKPTIHESPHTSDFEPLPS